MIAFQFHRVFSAFNHSNSVFPTDQNCLNSLNNISIHLKATMRNWVDNQLLSIMLWFFFIFFYFRVKKWQSILVYPCFCYRTVRFFLAFAFYFQVNYWVDVFIVVILHFQLNRYVNLKLRFLLRRGPPKK